MSKITFELTTPERNVVTEQVDQITLPTKEGEITVLPGHIPLVGVLVSGMATIKKDGEESYLAVSGGFIEVQPGSKVIVLADTAERAEELDVEKIEKAKNAAQRMLEEKREMADVSFADAAATLERELARLKVARKKYRGTSVRVGNRESRSE